MFIVTVMDPKKVQCSKGQLCDVQCFFFIMGKDTAGLKYFLAENSEILILQYCQYLKANFFC